MISIRKWISERQARLRVADHTASTVVADSTLESGTATPGGSLILRRHSSAARCEQ